MAAGRLEIDVTARLDRLDAGLARAEQMIKKAGGQIDSAMNTPTGKVAMTMGKVLGSMAALELGIKAFNASMKLTEALTAEFSGSAQDADKAFMEMGEIVKQLPAGIGPVAQAIEQLVMLVSGESEAIAENLKSAASGKAREDIAARLKDQRIVTKLMLEELDVARMAEGPAKESAQLALDKHKLLVETQKTEQDLLKLEKQSGVEVDGLLHQLNIQHGIKHQMLTLEKELADIEQERTRDAERRTEIEEGNLAVLAGIEKANEQKNRALQRTGSASTAMGRFVFGAPPSMEDQGELRAIKSVDETLKEIQTHLNLTLPALRAGILGIM
jgi:hypothetical protein